jgi:hypothetical protein
VKNLSQTSENPNAKKILRTVPFEDGFHFTIGGFYTGVTATSLFDFSSKLETIDIDSVVFHYPRGDFQNWINYILGDKELSNQMCFIRVDVSGEQLRKELLKMIQDRIRDLMG